MFQCIRQAKGRMTCTPRGALSVTRGCQTPGTEEQESVVFDEIAPLATSLQRRGTRQVRTFIDRIEILHLHRRQRLGHIPFQIDQAFPHCPYHQGRTSVPRMSSGRHHLQLRREVAKERRRHRTAPIVMFAKDQDLHDYIFLCESKKNFITFASSFLKQDNNHENIIIWEEHLSTAKRPR